MLRAWYTDCVDASSLPFVALGTHEYRVEGDLLHIRYRGKITPQDAASVMNLYREIRHQHQRVFDLIDGRAGAELLPESRKVFMSMTNAETRTDAHAMIGLPMGARVMAAMIVRAGRLMRLANVEIGFFSDEASARAFIDEKRQQLLRKSAQPQRVTRSSDSLRRQR